MPVRIVTDSTCDLPEDIILTNQVSVVPLYININGQSYKDRVDLSREDFYHLLPDCELPPTTAIPSTGVFHERYCRLIEDGATEIISIHVSERLSSVVATARLAAVEIKSLPVTVIDSRQLSMGMGFMVWKAAQMAINGSTSSQILEMMEDLVKRVYIFAMADTLEYLQRSGRMNKALAGLGTLLKIKPLLKMYDGNPTVERVRSIKGGTRRLLELVTELGPLEKLAIVHTHALDSIAWLREQAHNLHPSEDLPLCVDVTPVIGTHLGPGTLGFACVRR